jgi:hypothetical protein
MSCVLNLKMKNMALEQKEKSYSEKDAHKHFAVHLFNYTWDLIETPDRTQQENELMVHAAHSSAYHWLQVGAPVNFQRSAWQLARVYTILGDKEKSLYYAQRCYDMTLEQDLKDFDLAFAFEAMARTHALNGNKKEYASFKALAMEAGDFIKEEDDRDVFFKDINSGPWFGMQ